MYQQTFGTAMGSPVSVTVANLVMEDVEQRALATCEAQPPFWKRYVDDTLTAIPKGQIQKFHQHLNSIECSIQFTIEDESEGALPFLDTRITHLDDGTLSTTVFRKKTHTDRYLDFESHHPLAHKAAVARTLLTQAETICMDFPDKAREKERVTQVLRMNGYPRELVTKNWKPTVRPHRPEVSDTPKAKVILPYVRHLSETMRRILTSLGVYTCTRTPQNEQGRRPTTNGLQSPNPPSAPVLLRTCCCLHIILHFFFL